jgi:hypothetical protein
MSFRHGLAIAACILLLGAAVQAGPADKAPSASPSKGSTPPSAEPASPIEASAAPILGPLAPREEPQAPTKGFKALFDQANQAYLDEDYAWARAGYERLIDAGLVHPDLYCNMANASYRDGRIGLAVLFYEKALALDPSDDAAASNLASVRKELIDRVVMSDDGVVVEPLWHGFIRSLSLGWLTWSFLSLYTLVFGLLILRRLLNRGSLKRVIFWLNVPLLSVVVVLGVLLFSHIYVQERVHHGVIVAGTAPLREGPGRATKTLMEVHAGLKVRVLNEVAGHVRVQLANGVEGFVLDRQLGRI